MEDRKMADEPSIFSVQQADDRTVIAFRDWKSSRAKFRSPEEPVLLAEIGGELRRITKNNDGGALVVDLADADVLPSAFLGTLVSLYRMGVRIELFRPSASVLEMLRTTKLNRFLAVIE
jgi:hypothetical protein